MLAWQTQSMHICTEITKKAIADAHCPGACIPTATVMHVMIMEMVATVAVVVDGKHPCNKLRLSCKAPCHKRAAKYHHAQSGFTTVCISTEGNGFLTQARLPQGPKRMHMMLNPAFRWAHDHVQLHHESHSGCTH